MKQIIAFLSVFFLLNVAVAESLNIATVDVNRVLNESKEARLKKGELDAKTTEAKKKVEAKRDTLKGIEEKLKASNAAQDSKEVQSFRDQAKDYARFVKDTEDNLKEQFLKTNKTLTDKVLAHIKKYAESKNFDLVLDKSTRERGPVLYGTDTADITGAIIGMMNES